MKKANSLLRVSRSFESLMLISTRSIVETGSLASEIVKRKQKKQKKFEARKKATKEHFSLLLLLHDILPCMRCQPYHHRRRGMAMCGGRPADVTCRPSNVGETPTKKTIQTPTDNKGETPLTVSRFWVHFTAHVSKSFTSSRTGRVVAANKGSRIIATWQR